jgi:excinuclease ABC subunit C
MRDRIARLPTEPGVYRFRDADDSVLYIGRATSLRSRVASYWSDLRGRGHLAPMVTSIARIEAVAAGSVHEAAWLERNLLETALPHWNRTPGGQETVVYLRLDDRPAAPRLTVEHLVRPRDHARYFGPYLGGLRARQAARALGRIFPLSATGTRLRGAQLDIARARGVAGADRRVLIRRVAAVLERRPAAVATARTALEQLRDQAAGTLAFELAARLQAEIQSLDWITSTQRVAIMDATDFEICGWSGMTLVCFGVRGGRLSQWAQRGCSEAEAAPYLAATPASWARFAQRAAELAAALADKP